MRNRKKVKNTYNTIKSEVETRKWPKMKRAIEDKDEVGESCCTDNIRQL